MSYDASFLVDRQNMEIEEILCKEFLQVLYPVIKEFYSELILILFPDEFTSLDEMPDNEYSSRFQYPIDFAE